MPVKKSSKEEGDRNPQPPLPPTVFTPLAVVWPEITMMLVLEWRLKHCCVDTHCTYNYNRVTTVWTLCVFEQREREGMKVDWKIFAEPIRLGFQRAPLKDTLFV